jgi:hypothetical protein
MRKLIMVSTLLVLLMPIYQAVASSECSRVLNATVVEQPQRHLVSIWPPLEKVNVSVTPYHTKSWGGGSITDGETQRCVETRLEFFVPFAALLAIVLSVTFVWRSTKRVARVNASILSGLIVFCGGFLAPACSLAIMEQMSSVSAATAIHAELFYGFLIGTAAMVMAAAGYQLTHGKAERSDKGTVFTMATMVVASAWVFYRLPHTLLAWYALAIVTVIVLTALFAHIFLPAILPGDEAR